MRKEVVKTIKRVQKKVYYDDTKVRKLEREVAAAKKKYVPAPENIIELVEEEGDVIEKVIEVPKKSVKRIERDIEVVRFDDKKIKLLEKEFNRIKDTPEQWHEKLQKLIVEKNQVVEETVEKQVKVIKFVPRDVQTVKYNEEVIQVYENQLEGLKETLQKIIEQYKNLKNLDKKY